MNVPRRRAPPSNSSTESATGRGTSVTRGYAHPVPSQLREAVELLCTLKVVEFRREERSA